MKNEATYAKKFKTLFNRLRRKHPVDPLEPLEPVTQLVVAILQWNSTRKLALAAHDRLMERLVDNNDLRVCHPHEVVELIGQDYAQAEERAERLREVLQAIYVREHATSLDSLQDKPKKEVKTYLDSLPGMLPYVAAEVTLLCFGGHAFPVDEQLVEKLRDEEAIDPEASLPEVQSFLERQFKAGTAAEGHTVLRAWVDAGARRTRPRAATTK